MDTSVDELELAIQLNSNTWLYRRQLLGARDGILNSKNICSEELRPRLAMSTGDSTDMGLVMNSSWLKICFSLVNQE